MDIIIAFNLLKNHDDDDDDEVYVIHCTVLVTKGEPCEGLILAKTIF